MPHDRSSRTILLSIWSWSFFLFACAPFPRDVTSTVEGYTSLDIDEAFFAKPYLQLGTDAAPDRLTLVWHVRPGPETWGVEVGHGGRWRGVHGISKRSVAVSRVEPHEIYQAELTGLPVGKPFVYRVLRDGTSVFASHARAPKPTAMPTRIVVFGDAGAGTLDQARVAHQVYQQQPDLVAITGDVVYGSGRMSEYQQRFFPYYNARISDPAIGAPLMRSTPFVAALGNHDVGFHRLPLDARRDDVFGYFAYWVLPRNGPLTTAGDPSSPTLVGNSEIVRALTDVFGSSYPRTANYSFDYGDIHWTVLDSNPYVDWTAPVLRDWLERDLQAAQRSVWRFVAFHHPGIQSATIHSAQLQTHMRIVSDLFERYNVALVFSGHYHHYQRSRPVRFTIDLKERSEILNRSAKNGKQPMAAWAVPGRFTIDSKFDGVANTRPEGVIYIVSGAGGAALYEPDTTARPERWQPYTAQFIATMHSFTVVDVQHDKLTLKQISDRGDEIDRIIITSAAPQND